MEGEVRSWVDRFEVLDFVMCCRGRDWLENAKLRERVGVRGLRIREQLVRRAAAVLSVIEVIDRSLM
jgi:hypothetical protein